MLDAGNIDVGKITKLARSAGAKIMEYYESRELEVEYKDDESPLTMADRDANAIIVKGLKEIYPDIPVLSEEIKSQPFSERKNWETFWVVDPLDGTKEFVKGLNEFTVNIALVTDDSPVFGCVYAPVIDEMFYGLSGQGAKKIDSEGEKSISVNGVPSGEKVVISASRSHRSEEVDQYIEKLKSRYSEVETISSGSSLKLCRVAEGVVDIYPRLSPTMEWDTAAGHAVVSAAGGCVIDVSTGMEMTYNKEVLRNNHFMVFGFSTDAAADFMP